ncbi:MAG: hypothetical protein HKP03_00410, partial [Xanthomonadales bacterium]|nr:hypothetical protein [Xanthomonadales bacterium]
HRVLSALRAEFRVNADKLPNFIANHERTAEHARALIRALNEAGPGSRVSFEESRLMWLISSSSTDPQRGALDAVLQSGELRYISSQAVRERLAAWPQLIVDAAENEELLRKIYSPMFNRALARHVNLARIDSIPEECWRLFDERCRVGDFEIPYDTVLIGILTNLRGFSAEAAREFGLVRNEALAVVDLIDRELDALE